MSRWSMHYINCLSDVSFVLSHRAILERAKKISNPRVAGLMAPYETFIQDLEKVVHVPCTHFDPRLNQKRVRSYTICRKAIDILKNSDPKNLRETVETLALAFRQSVYRAPIEKVNGILDGTEQIVKTVPRHELETLNIASYIDGFVKLNQDSRQSREAKKNNRKVRKQWMFWNTRDNCIAMYRVLQNVVQNLSYQGDKECEQFMVWTKDE